MEATAGPVHDELRRLAGGASIDGLLALVRQHLDVDAAFVAEFDGDERVVRHAAVGPGAVLRVGRRDPIEDSFCWRMASGQVEAMVGDAAAHPGLRDLRLRRELRIRAYGAAPITFSDGALFGTLCVLGHRPDPTLDARDERFLRLVASLIGEQLERELRRREADLAERRHVEHALTGADPDMVFQPIVELSTGAVAGFEALARFRSGPRRPPDAWFASAARAGLGLDLELKAVQQALGALAHLPVDAYLAVNVGAATFCSRDLLRALEGADVERLVLELTEHDLLDDLRAAQVARRRLQRLGVRLAVDDVGTGYAGLAQLLALAPDVAKLDRSIVAGLHRHAGRRALVGAAVAVGTATGVGLVAEGVEDALDLDALRGLGVPHAQGWALGRPGPLSSVDG